MTDQFIQGVTAGVMLSAATYLVGHYIKSGIEWYRERNHNPKLEWRGGTTNYSTPGENGSYGAGESGTTPGDGPSGRLGYPRFGEKL